MSTSYESAEREEQLSPLTASDESRSDIESFIVVHDQDILLESERRGRYVELPRSTYLFVGMGQTNLIEDRDDVIVARHLPDNIEDNPRLLSFTAWYAVAKNDLAASEHVVMVEYDTTAFEGFTARTSTALAQTHCITGYVPFRLSHPMYMHATHWFTTSLSSIYGIDVPALIGDHLRQGGKDLWTSTTNTALRTKDLRRFVDWFMPLTTVFLHDPVGAHVHERTVPIFCLLNQIANTYVPGVLEHTQARSHGVLAVSQEEARTRASNLLPPPP
ncbi:MAG: hypothetical protein GY926_23180 [bacterium]|nr:hypothetical protein [bacterium]